MSDVVSVEQLNVGNRSRLAIELHEVVVSMKAYADEKDDLSADTERLLADVISRNTLMSVTVQCANSGPFATAVVENVAGNHSSVNKRFGKSFIESDPMSLQYLTGTVDLENAKVDGGFKDIPVMIRFRDVLFWDFEPEEITAALLHEIGHAFWCFATIGDYVWLNYYLQDGIDVMLGNKKNTYRINSMVIGDLERASDQLNREALKETKNKETLRRAVIGYFTNTGRAHLHSVSKTSSWKRDEQLADWFVTRHGYALPLATLIHKTAGARSTMPKNVAVLFETITLMTLPATIIFPLNVFIPLSWWFVMSFGSDLKGAYDSSKQRIEKARREVIAQLSQIAISKEHEKRLLESIKKLDIMLAQMNDTPSGYDLITYLIMPRRRRDRQMLAYERQLETFLNNDLYVGHSKLRQYL